MKENGVHLQIQDNYSKVDKEKTFGIVYSFDKDFTSLNHINALNVAVQTVAPYCNFKIIPVTSPFERSTHISKTVALRQSPFDITLYLDGDTLVLNKNILTYEHWDTLLGNKKYAVTSYPGEHGTRKGENFHAQLHEYPLFTVFYNSGVFAVRKPYICTLADMWLEQFSVTCSKDNKQWNQDEPSFNVVMQTMLHEETVVLPNEYNNRSVDVTKDTKIKHFYGQRKFPALIKQMQKEVDEM
jgi:hypothetical protein